MNESVCAIDMPENSPELLEAAELIILTAGPSNGYGSAVGRRARLAPDGTLIADGPEKTVFVPLLL